jgi:hypothetical protein
MPGTRGLLQAIECLHQATEMLRTSKINKTRRLAHVDLFLQYTMEKSILNIHLTKIPAPSNSK